MCNCFSFNPDPTVRHTVWTVCIGGGIFWGAIYGINQAQVQRAISLPTVRSMQIAVWLNFPGFVLIQTLACSVGLVMFAYFHTCDPAKLGVVKKTDQVRHIYTV
ncbi:hypothetical protein KUTeg_002993 [Tegillarca granosa]|uniref:Uncharacterized protein n=1 Tax=Tegillarca granosa TaxID=220873 RepID=A0ABQ9FKT5_TEGGR|nr:hypothetical protein KUTeg_002993 [Tegillarca granosa]